MKQARVTLSELPDPHGGTIQWFRYVNHGDRAKREAEGWVFVAELGPTHGHWSVLMALPLGQEPPEEPPRG